MRPSAALFRRAMVMQRPVTARSLAAVVAFDLGGLRRVEHVAAGGRPIARLDMPAGAAAAFIASPPVVAALNASAAIIATCSSAADAEALRMAINREGADAP